MKHTSETLRTLLSEAEAIYISDSFLDIVNEQSCDCDKLVIQCGDKYTLLSYESVADDGHIIFEEITALPKVGYSYEVQLADKPFVLDQFHHLENGMIDGIRYENRNTFLFVFALEHNLVLTMSKYDLFEEIEMDLPTKEERLIISKRTTPKLFCDESVIAVYHGYSKDDFIEGSDEFFNIFDELAYHVTKGYRIVLETEHFYISLGHSGVIKTEKNCSIEEFALENEWLDPFVHDLGEDKSPWIEYESTLFVGERLCNVQQIENYYLLTFDDFQMKLIPYKMYDDHFPTMSPCPDHRSENFWNYLRVLGTERYLTVKCHCGGKGELLLDFVSDFVVRCQKCKLSTWAKMTADEAIKEWNDGHIQCDLSDITIE